MVYLPISRGRFNPTRYDAVVALYGEVRRTVEQLPGFWAYYGGIDRNSGVIAAVNVFETEAQARWPREALRDVFDRLLAIGTTFEPMDIYEIVA
jgi:hypothetical protein